jgi:fructose 1,6-bisphosphate aldolase/phosphatase
VGPRSAFDDADGAQASDTGGQAGLPAVGEVLEPFAFPHTVAGCMRGSHHAPLMPVAAGQTHPSRFDGPPRVVCLGYQLSGGKLVGPRDMFDDPRL